MYVLFAMSIFYIGYGILGLFGKMNIPEKFKGYDWTKDYIRNCGISYILLGIPWLVLYFAFEQYDPGYGMMFLLIILLALPSFGYTIYNEKKYSKLIKKD